MNFESNDAMRREELIRVIEHSVENLQLQELEALYYDMLSKDYISQVWNKVCNRNNFCTDNLMPQESRISKSSSTTAIFQRFSGFSQIIDNQSIPLPPFDFVFQNHPIPARIRHQIAR